jgi:hypothetical protein
MKTKFKVNDRVVVTKTESGDLPLTIIGRYGKIVLIKRNKNIDDGDHLIYFSCWRKCFWMYKEEIKLVRRIL